MAEKKRPKRYRLYDKLKLSLNQANMIIDAIMGLIVLALILGVVLK